MQQRGRHRQRPSRGGSVPPGARRAPRRVRQEAPGRARQEASQRARHTGDAAERERQVRRSLAPDRRKQARRPQRHAQPPKRPRQVRAPRRHRAYGPVLSLAASVALIATTMLTFVNAMASDAGRPAEVSGQPVTSVDTHVENVDELFVSPYDWDALRVTNGDRYVYVADDGDDRLPRIISRTGIDVSEHQQEIDWGRVARDGVDFAIIRIGYRGIASAAITKDATFDRNLKAARDAGLEVGVYFYSLATSEEEAREEAAFVVDALAGEQLEYPVVFDMEPTDGSTDRLQLLTKDQMTAIAQAFCERVEAAGYHACVYGNQTDLSRYHLMRLAHYGFWYAQYGTAPTMSLRFALWQYTQQGEVDGIEGSVDLDVDLTAILNGG